MGQLDICRAMARYNHWQNRNLLDAADTLTDAARRVDRGAFFGSIFGTLNHLLWGDMVWMSRFAGWEAPAIGIPDSPGLHDSWDNYKTARLQADDGIRAWADALTAQDLEGELGWYSAVAGAEVSRPRGLLIQHVFNHQTHHRGQVHAMLTAAGAQPGATDLAFMPDFA